MLTRSKFNSCSNLMGKIGEWRWVCCSCPSRQTRTRTGGPSRCITVPWLSFHCTCNVTITLYETRYSIKGRHWGNHKVTQIRWGGHHSKVNHLFSLRELQILFTGKEIVSLHSKDTFCYRRYYRCPPLAETIEQYTSQLSPSPFSCSSGFACRMRRHGWLARSARWLA